MWHDNPPTFTKSLYLFNILFSTYTVTLSNFRKLLTKFGPPFIDLSGSHATIGLGNIFVYPNRRLKIWRNTVLNTNTKLIWFGWTDVAIEYRLFHFCCFFYLKSVRLIYCGKNQASVIIIHYRSWDINVLKFSYFQPAFEKKWCFGLIFINIIFWVIKECG